MKLKQFLAAALMLCSAGAWAQTDVTITYITNADFSSMTGWTEYKAAQYVNIGSGLIGTFKPTGNVAATIDATHLNTEYCIGFQARWNTNYTAYQQTTTELPVGHYELSYDVEDVNNSSVKINYDNLFYVEVGSDKIVDSNAEWMEAGKSSWTAHTISFDITSATAVKISLGYGNKEDKNATPIIYVSHLKLTQVPFATSSDYEALNTAISTVEGKAWGFDQGEYAPYNYVEVIQALASAQAIDQTANNSQATVQALTSTLNTAMTTNAAEVNAIWDPSFEHDYSGQSGNVQPIGWYRQKDNYTGDGTNVRYMNLPSGTNTSGHGVFGKFTLMYGEEPGYTLPLNEAYYTLSFIYGGWNEVGTREIRLYNDDNSAEVYTKNVTAINNQAHTTSSAYSTYNGFIKVPAAGNYVLSFYRQSTNAQNQIVLSDFVLKTTTVAEATAYYNTVKDEVDDSYDADANGGSEKTAFNDALNASMEGKTVAQIMEAAAALYTLRDAFVAATPKYDAYLAEKANAERIAASITSGVSAPTTAAEAETALQTILVNEYNYVASNFNADAAATYGITIDQWTGTATSGGNSDTPQTKSNEKWGETATTYYEQGQNGWGSNAWTLNYTKTVTLPANTYVMKVAARASTGATATLKATIGGTTITESLPNIGNTGLGITTDGVASFDGNDTFANSDNGYGWQWRYLAFTLENDGEVTLQIDASANTINQWCSFGDVAVVSNVSTTAMEAAYNNFTMQTLGFENGQYAPYNNVAVLEAYAQAKAIVEGTAVPSTQVEVDAITATLTSPSWTVNTGDVDAIFNGDFSSQVEGDWGLTGWTRTNGWGQQREDVAGGYGYYNQPGSLKYGDTGVYTMPLKANTIYSLTFKYASWEDNSNDGITVSVLNGEDGMAAKTFDANKTKYTSGLVQKTILFVTGAAGNYVLTLANSGNTVITGVSITKAASQVLEFVDGSVPSYAPGTYPSVKITRTLTANRWATAIYPFAVSGVDNIAVLDSYDASTGALGFKAADVSTANEPFLMRSTAGTTEISLSNVAVAAAAATDAVKGEASLKGAYTSTDITNAEKNYVLSNNQIYSVGTAGATINPYRAYIQIAESAPVKALTFFVDDTETAIEGIEATEMQNGEIYNLAGQRVNKAQKGIYIVNGKKVLVK